jgi:energy-coupling factor transporter ATP-binding protein EcfA2
MKLLKMAVNGLTLFKGTVNIDFFAEQRVSSDNNEMVSPCFGSVYTNNVMSVVGINASGKTSLLKVISFVIEFINGESVNNINNKDILKDSEKIEITVFFFDPGNGVCKLESEIIRIKDNEIDYRYIINSERLWVKKTSRVKSKKDLFVFDDDQLSKVRDNGAEFLKDDTSIVISLNKNKGFYLKDLIRLTNVNFLGLIGNFPHELIAFLDPSIENISFDKKTGEAKLKFYDREEIVVANPILFEQYLSSGTIKGINIFINAMIVFEEGGYLIVDELENHFNREIVATLVRFFMNKSVNKNGATLIFSTHYSELLDEFERNDGIYIVRNRNGIYAQKLSEILTRNDIKKSEAFKSDFLEGTVPTYESYMQLKKAIILGKIKEE